MLSGPFFSRLGSGGTIVVAIPIAFSFAAVALIGNPGFPWDMTNWRAVAIANSAELPRPDSSVVQPLAPVAAASSAAAASASLAMLQDAPTPAPSPLAGPQISGSGFEYAIGDLLKITFFERLQNEAASQDGGRIGALVERTELSGQYTVQLDGSVFLPMLGEVPIAGSSEQVAQKVLSERGQRILGGNLEVSVAVIDREPVYVMGALPRSGTFKHSPGMLVAQVVALAGGDSNGASETWQQMDVAREHERLRRSLQRQINNLALAEVLEAEAKNTPAMPSERLTALAGPRAAELIASLSDARQLERSRLEGQIASLEKMIGFTHKELAAARERLNEVAALVEERGKRFEAVSTRFDRGASTEALVAMAKSELIEIQSRGHELRSAIARAEARVIELERDRDQIAISARIDHQQQLRSARDAVAEEENVASTIGQILMTMPQLASSSRGRREKRYTIIRRGVQGATELPVDSMTPVRPGDVVRLDDFVPSIAARDG
jgi:protein involved in polysaccharide export with SLBB domain